MSSRSTSTRVSAKSRTSRAAPRPQKQTPSLGCTEDAPPTAPLTITVTAPTAGDGTAHSPGVSEDAGGFTSVTVVGHMARQASLVEEIQSAASPSISEERRLLEGRSDASEANTGLSGHTIKPTRHPATRTRAHKTEALRRMALVQAGEQRAELSDAPSGPPSTVDFETCPERTRQELDEDLDRLGVDRPTSRTDDEWSDVASNSSRRSMLPPTQKRAGLPMDQATIRANELLQAGKEALEKAGNMKRESKVEAHESLQSLYELALSLSDSRSRHRVALEQERTRAARELVMVERAHTRQLSELHVSLSQKLVETRTLSEKGLKAAETIQTWLNFELDGPLKAINGMKAQFEALQTLVSPDTRPSCIAQREIKALGDWMSVMRAEINNLQDSFNRIIHSKENPVIVPPPSPPTTPAREAPELRLEPVLIELKALRAEMAELLNRQSPPPPSELEIREGTNGELQPVKQQLREIGRTLEDIKECKQADLATIVHDQNTGLGTEMALVDLGEKLRSVEATVSHAVNSLSRKVTDHQVTQAADRPSATQARPPAPRTFAQAAATPRFTIMVESADPRHTGDEIIKKIKTGVDVVNLGVGISGLRKCRNSRVAISVSSEEERGRMGSAIKKLGHQFTVTEPKARNPLLRLVGVTPDMTDAKVEEALEKQNSGLLSDVEPGQFHVKVVRRTKGRGGAVNNVIVEVSPTVWSSLKERRVRLGYQIVPAVDHSPLVQCYRCMGFAHRASECRASAAVCGYCSEGHDTRGCPNRDGPPTCTHCKAGIDGPADSNHPAYSAECSEWRKWDRISRLGINLGRGRAATQECLHEATRRGFAILLVQEPYVGANAHITSCQGYRVIQRVTNDTNRPVRAAIIILDPNAQYVVNHDIVTEDMVGASIVLGSARVGFVSFYFDKEKDIEEGIASVKNAANKMDTQDIVVGGDANARSLWWGCEAEDSRGAALAESLAEMDLEILNTGNTPTFHVFRNGQACSSIVDITACTTSMLHRVGEWRVDEDFCTLSDHRPILFSITIGRESAENAVKPTTRKFNTLKADWTRFGEELTSLLQESDLTVARVGEATTGETVDSLVRAYAECVTKACDASIPRVGEKKMKVAGRWWSSDLRGKKREMIRLRRKIGKANPRRKPYVIKDYMDARDAYKEDIERTATGSWRDLCTSEIKENVWQRSYRIMKLCASAADDKLLVSPDGNTLGARESAMLLADTFYPDDDPGSDNSEQAETRENVQRSLTTLGDHHQSLPIIPFTEAEIAAVFRKMSPKKAPGGDGFTSDICHRAYMASPSLLLALFNRCLEVGHFPADWKTAIIKVIPKPAKEDYTKPRSYRPIGLLPVLGKTLEKLFVNRLQWQLGKEDRLSSRQYGFTQQRSTEDALYDAIRMMEQARNNKKIVVVVSLDIEGAFDNAWWPAVLQQLEEKAVDRSILRLIHSYLSGRAVTMRYAGTEVSKATTKGCIQGSTCGPILWNVQLDPLLQKAEEMDVHLQAFADDLLIVAQGDTARELEVKVNAALEIIARWGEKHKMKFAAQKTQAILSTRKLKYEVPRLYLNGCAVSFVERVKILGLCIDRTLNFKNHLEEVCGKAVGLYRSISRLARAQWGLNSEIIRIIYLAVVEPTILYAAGAWGMIANRAYAKSRLQKISRIFAIKIAKAHRTVSFASAVTLARILPLDLRASEDLELYEVKRGKPLPTLPGRKLQTRASPFALPHPAHRELVEFQHINSEDDLATLPDSWTNIFTDGSKLEGKVGAGFTCWRNGAEMAKSGFRLESYCSVFQAELAAILGALEWMTKRRNWNANILSDSRAGLLSVSDPDSLNPLAVEIRNKIGFIKEKGGSVALYWIKAHVGIAGNERADELAKNAALHNRQRPAYDCFPLSYAKRTIRDSTLSAWQQLYTETKTGEVTKKFFPDVRKANKVLSSIVMTNPLSQLFTGHGGNRAYLFRFKLMDTPFCTCDDESPQTLEHVIVRCQRFSRQRYECECRMEMSISMDNAHLFLDNDRRPDFLNYALAVLRVVGKENGSF